MSKGGRTFGAPASSLLCRGRGNGQPYVGGRAAIAYLAAVLEPADSRSGKSGGLRVTQSRRARCGVDRRGPRVSGPRALGVDPGGLRRRGGPSGVETYQEAFCARLPDRVGNDLV